METIIKDFDLDTFWQWESKISEQEVDYYEGLLRELKSQIDQEIADRLSPNDQNPKSKAAKAIIQEVEDKYAEKKRVLVRGYERAKTEEIVLHKQKDYRKYEKAFESYAFPINQFRISESNLNDIKSMVEEENQIAINKV